MKLQDVKSLYFWETKVNNQIKNDLLIASLDPLSIDREMTLLPILNQSADVKSIIKVLYNKIPYPETLENFSTNESLAAMRDLGFYLGSLKRHGVEPVEAVPELDYILDVLGSKTDLPPRDTLMHYTLWNPKGNRRRSYTHFQDEKDLIDSVVVSYRPLVKGIYYLAELHQMEMDDPKFITLCEATESAFRTVLEGIVIAKKKVSPEIFAQKLRFYFDPICLHNREIIGPGAVEMPMFVYDHLLWSCDVDDDEYTLFKSTYLPFSQSEIRDIYYNYLKQPSLVTKMCAALERKRSITLIESAKALYSLCKLQISFRMPHKKLADKAYSHQTNNSKEKGSGGYSPSVLRDIINLNRAQIKRLFDTIYSINSEA